MELYNEDCFKVLPTIADKSVDMICVDLPYGTTDVYWDTPLCLDTLWQHYKRILSDKGCVVLFGCQPFTSKLVTSNLKWFKQVLIWNKNKCGSPGLANVRPMQVHEDIVIFAPGRTIYNPQMEKGEPYSRKSTSPDGYKERCNTHGYGMKIQNEFVNTGTRYPKSIVNISRNFSAQQQLHPTQKPVPLLEWLIKTYSNEHDTVLDHCMGIGTCGVAAVKNNRRFIGVEMQKDYFDIAFELITKEK